MTLSEIIHSIYAGLSGDNLQDLNYLKQLAQKYSGHKYEKEILETLSQLFIEIVSKEERENDAQKNFQVDEILMEVETYMQNKNYNMALQVCEELVLAFEEQGYREDSALVTYKFFREPIEEILYVGLQKEEKEVFPYAEDYAQMYVMYGTILFELQNYDEAQQAFLKALEINPMHFLARSEYIRVFTYKNDLDRFLEATDDAFKYAYTPNHYAHLLLNIAVYYYNIQYFDIAVACIYYALSFQFDNEMAMDLLAEISKETNKEWPCPDFETVSSLMKQYEIPKAPNPEVIKILYAFIHNYRDLNENLVYYLCEYVYALTQEEAMLKIMQEIQSKDYVDMGNIQPEEIADGSIIKRLSRVYQREPNEDHFYDLLYVLKDMEVIVPAYLEDLGYEEGMHPDLLQGNDGRVHFPIFTKEEEMPEEYAQKFSRVHVPFMQCIKSARRQKNVVGIVLNPFTTSVELSFEELRLMETMNFENMN